MKSEHQQYSDGSEHVEIPFWKNRTLHEKNELKL